MLENWKWARIALTTLLVAGVLSGSLAWAKKPPKDPPPDPDPPSVPYTITMLGTLGGSSSVAQGMNEAGDVVGRSETADGWQHAFLSTTDADGHRIMRDLNDLLGPADQARWILKQALDINDFGQIVGGGDLFDADGNRVDGSAFRFTPGSPPLVEHLGTLGGSSSGASGINNHGDVVGSSLDANGKDRAFLFTDTDGDGTEEMIDLGLLDGATRMTGHSVNNFGQAAGSSHFGSANFIYRAWRFTPDLGTENLGVISKNRGNISESRAIHINDDGNVVGWSTAGRNKYHAFLYTDDEGMKDLGTFGGKDSEATGINNVFGDVVGWAETDDGVRHLFLYTDESGMARIEVVGGWPAPLYHNIQAKINNFGEISGTVGDVSQGQPLEAFLLTPLP